jgi:dihydrofolate reductase
MEIVLIAAMAKNRVIGRNNEIPWHIPGEQKIFRQTTWGYPLVMGRKTHESIGCVLPGRRNIIITGNRRYQSKDCEIVHSLTESIQICDQEKKIFIIGGGQLFKQFIKLADTLILSILDKEISGDTFFPDFSKTDFKLVQSRRITTPVAYRINTYCRSRTA